MSTLLTTLSNLKLPTGKPDLEARGTQLTELFTALPLSEARLVKELIEIVEFRKDIMGNLPVEIMIIIAGYLGPEDFFTCRGVSRAWRAKLGSRHVALVGLRKWFPSVLNRDSENGEVDLSAVLMERLLLALKRVHGKYESVAMYKYNDAYDEIKQSYYSHGRLAFKPCSNAIVVWDLRAGSKIRYVLPHRQDITVWSMSSHCLVAASNEFMGRGAVRAWFLDDPDDWGQEIQLPNSCRWLHACRSVVGICTDSYEYLVWNIGGSVRSLECELGRFDNSVLIIPDSPQSEQCFVLAFELTMDASQPLLCKSTVYVQEFQKSKIQREWTLEVPAILIRPAHPVHGTQHEDILIGFYPPLNSERRWTSEYLAFNTRTAEFQHKDRFNVDAPEDWIPLSPHLLRSYEDDHFTVLTYRTVYVVWCFDDTTLACHDNMLERHTWGDTGARGDAYWRPSLKSFRKPPALTDVKLPTA